VVSSYTPTLTSLSRAQQTPTTYTIKDMRLVTVVAEQAHDSTMPFLRYAAQEAKEVAATATKAGLAVSSVAQTASKEDVIASLASAHAVHFACHGIQDDAEPHKSHFCLGDGDLTISDLLGASMDHGFLAFLSACETAQGDLKHADEVVHLAATMLFAGFKSVVATMWSEPPSLGTHSP
jgi:CHAT domain-containing protein